LFLAKKEKVESLEVWLNTVLSRLHEADYQGNKKIFMFPFNLAITSIGDPAHKNKMEAVLANTDLMDLLVNEFELLDPFHHGLIDTLDLKDYFADENEGKLAIKNYIMSLVNADDDE
jgi:hypothetical protein